MLQVPHIYHVPTFATAIVVIRRAVHFVQINNWQVFCISIVNNSSVIWLGVESAGITGYKREYPELIIGDTQAIEAILLCKLQVHCTDISLHRKY